MNIAAVSLKKTKRKNLKKTKQQTKPTQTKKKKQTTNMETSYFTTDLLTGHSVTHVVVKLFIYTNPELLL